MPIDEKKANELTLEIELLKRDCQQMTTLTDKFGISIEKIQEMNSNVLRMISLHEQKHEQHIITENELKEDIKELHSRITTVNRELHDKIDQLERHLAGKLDNLSNEMKRHESVDAQRNKVSNILREIDKYKYLIIGGAIAVGWIIGNINLAALGTLIK